MGDWLTPDQRHRNMSSIRARGTTPELRLLAALRVVFPRRRVQAHPPLTGRPDYYLPALRLAVFADGCYWHGCPLHGRTPQDNNDYWSPKLARNRKRDRFVTAALRAEGCSVVRVWEHDLGRTNGKLAVRLRRAGTLALVRRRARDAEARRARRDWLSCAPV